MSVDLRPLPKHHYTPSHTPLSLSLIPSKPQPASPTASLSPSSSPFLSPSTLSPSSPPLSASPPSLSLLIKQDHHQHNHAHHHQHHHHQHHQHTHHHHHHHHLHSPLLPSTSLIRRSFWNLACSCLFSSLPDEILLFDVFCYVDAKQLCILQGVCTRWKFLSADPMLWRGLDLSSVGSRMDDFSLHSLLSKYSSSLSTLKLCNCTKLTSAFLHRQQEFTALSHLKELHLCNLKSVTDITVTTIAAAAPQLEHVSLYGCLQLTDEAVLSLSAAPLVELSLRGLIKITNAAISSLPSSLRGLNIAGCKLISSAALLSVASTCPLLERLNAHGINLSDAAIDVLTKNCPALETLHLSSANPFGGNQLTDAAIHSLARLSSLTCLNLQGSSNVTDASMVALLQDVRLQRLNLGGCYRLTDATLSALASSQSSLTLTHLSVFQCFHMTDSGVLEIVEGMRQLVHLDLHSCVALTGRVLDQVGERGERKVGRRRRSQQGLMEESEGEEEEREVGEWNLPNLQTLDVGSCRGVSAENVAELRTVRPQLNIVHY